MFAFMARALELQWYEMLVSPCSIADRKDCSGQQAYVLSIDFNQFFIVLYSCES